VPPTAGLHGVNWFHPTKKGAPNRPARRSPAKGCREQYRPALPFGARFGYCFSTFKGLAAQVRGFRRSSSLTPRRQFKLSPQSYDGILPDASRPGIAGSRRWSAWNLLAATVLWLRIAGPVAPASARRWTPVTTASTAAARLPESRRSSSSMPHVIDYGNMIPAGDGPKPLTEICRVRGRQPRVTTDEGAAGCADCEGWIGRDDFDPTGSLLVGRSGVCGALSSRLSTVNRLDNRAQVGTSEGLPRAFIRRARRFAVDSRGAKYGKASGHRTTQRGKAQRDRAMGMATRAQQKRAGVFPPVRIRNELCCF
jgi:hypothetical protein